MFYVKHDGGGEAAVRWAETEKVPGGVCEKKQIMSDGVDIR